MTRPSTDSASSPLSTRGRAAKNTIKHSGRWTPRLRNWRSNILAGKSLSRSAKAMSAAAIIISTYAMNLEPHSSWYTCTSCFNSENWHTFRTQTTGKSQSGPHFRVSASQSTPVHAERYRDEMARSTRCRAGPGCVPRFDIPVLRQRGQVQHQRGRGGLQRDTLRIDLIYLERQCWYRFGMSQACPNLVAVAPLQSRRDPMAKIGRDFRSENVALFGVLPQNTHPRREGLLSIRQLLQVIRGPRSGTRLIFSKIRVFRDSRLEIVYRSGMIRTCGGGRKAQSRSEQQQQSAGSDTCNVALAHGMPPFKFRCRWGRLTLSPLREVQCRRPWS